jgi:predicted nucleotidyltransferase
VKKRLLNSHPVMLRMIDFPYSRSYHGIVRGTVNLSLDEIRSSLLPFLKQSGVEKAIVFGSHARGTQDRKSDLDLILVMETSDRFFKRYDRITGIYRALPSVELEVLIYTPEELDRNSTLPFFRKVLEEGKVIYERGKEQE